ncbi:MAG: hypothetical protein GX620_12895, partial [Chloroflexi bacterium]|nr:hypothetical protein [Chloroflexota bacterium]
TAPSALAAYGHYVDDCAVADDVKGFVITAWDDEPIGDSTADMLIIQNAGEDADFPLPDPVTNEAMQEYADAAWHWAEANRGYGDFVVCKMASEDILRFSYDGTTANPETDDSGFVSYTSHRYPGSTDGQVKRIYTPQDDRLTAYIMFHRTEPGTHRALRVEWVPDSKGGRAGGWQVSNFYRDNARDYREMQICALFDYYDYVHGVEVTTQKSNLNVRAWPNGDIIGSLQKGSIIRIYRCEEIADNGIPYTLMSKWTDFDENDNTTFEYFGWVASEYITESPNWVWILGN